MSKKKPGKKSAKKAPAKKTAAKKTAGKAASAARRPVRKLATEYPKTTAAVTIFLYKTAGGQRIRTSPQLLVAAPGEVEWTVVNLASDEAVKVEITWPKGSPWGGEPITITNGVERKSLADAKAGRYKYNITANGYTEDPELEYPMN